MFDLLLRYLAPVEGDRTFVPPGFDVPTQLETPSLVLEPLGPEHNERDFEAWTSSIDHIRATPGFEGRSWPHLMTLEENLGDLEMHARHFRDREGFTYTVLGPDRDVIGCVYIYPADDDEHDARVLSWVRSSQRELDSVLRREVSGWLERDWPFERVAYAPRG
jgi:RimJ/RimL family protein N-acetyltransferase